MIKGKIGVYVGVHKEWSKELVDAVDTFCKLRYVFEMEEIAFFSIIMSFARKSRNIFIIKNGN